MIKNMRNARIERGDVRIDRATKWGNPFKMENETQRERVISDYKRWLWTKIKNQEIDLEELAALHGKNLCCWCAPKPCHGDVLAAAAAWAATRNDEDPS